MQSPECRKVLARAYLSIIPKVHWSREGLIAEFGFTDRVAMMILGVISGSGFERT